MSRRGALLALAAAALSACAGVPGSKLARTRCDPQPPCPEQIAVVVRLTPQGRRGPVPDAFVSIREAGGTSELRTLRCDAEPDASVCRIPGGPGTYDLVAGAPGFGRPTARTVVADTTAGACCPSVGTQEVDVQLPPAAR